MGTKHKIGEKSLFSLVKEKYKNKKKATNEYQRLLFYINNYKMTPKEAIETQKRKKHLYNGIPIKKYLKKHYSEDYKKKYQLFLFYSKRMPTNEALETIKTKDKKNEIYLQQ